MLCVCSHIHHSSIQIQGGDLKNQNLFIKIVYLFLHVSISVTLQCSPFDAIYLSRHFFHCSKMFLKSLILMPFSVSADFCFTSSTLTKHFPLWTFFYLEKQTNKKSLGARSGEQGGWGTGDMLFGVKTCEHSVQCGQVRW